MSEDDAAFEEAYRKFAGLVVPWAVDLPHRALLDMKQAARACFARGQIHGVTQFAHWEDGAQYVGPCGTVLADAVTDIEDQCRASCERIIQPNPR